MNLMWIENFKDGVCFLSERGTYYPLLGIVLKGSFRPGFSRVPYRLLLVPHVPRGLLLELYRSVARLQRHSRPRRVAFGQRPHVRLGTVRRVPSRSRNRAVAYFTWEFS